VGGIFYTWNPSYGKRTTGRRRLSKLLDVATANSLSRKKLQKGFFIKLI
jgi:hypothetical protein